MRKLSKTWEFSNAGTTLTMNLARARGIQQNYTGVCPSQPGASTYTDTAGIAGDLYRVQAVNSVGSSLSSVAVLAN